MQLPTNVANRIYYIVKIILIIALFSLELGTQKKIELSLQLSDHIYTGVRLENINEKN